MDFSSAAFFVTTCVIIYTIFNVVQKLGRQELLVKHSTKFPGPPTLPIIGNAHQFSRNIEDVARKFLEWGELYPSPYRLWLGNRLLIVINTSEQIKAILLNPTTIDKGELFAFGEIWLGTGLITASDLPFCNCSSHTDKTVRSDIGACPIGEWQLFTNLFSETQNLETHSGNMFRICAKWQLHRKLIQPTFSSLILKSFVGVFAARAKPMADEMERHLDGPEFVVHDYIHRCTLRITCGTIMGVDLGSRTNGHGHYAEAVMKVTAGICARALSPWLYPNLIFNRTKLGKEQQKHITFLHNFSDNVIRTKKKELLEESQRPGLSADNKEDTSNRIPRRKILLDHLIAASQDGKILSDESLREEVDTLIVAGSDTTANTILFVMLMLASHPEIQDKVYEELCEIYGNDDNEHAHVTPDELTHMTYMECVIKETMRLFPIVPVIVRSVSKDLVVGEHTLPSGSTILISFIELHRNENYWPDPMKFDPDRFLPENIDKQHPYSYLPFSGGPRNCIGMKYAMMSMKTLLATILRRYVLKKDHIVPVKDIRLGWEFVLRTVDPITMRIEKRRRKFTSI